MMEYIADILVLDNVMAAAFFTFLVLWHNRTKERDKQFFETMREMMSLLRDCQEDMSSRRE